jgi:hypothetical protein
MPRLTLLPFLLLAAFSVQAADAVPAAPPAVKPGWTVVPDTTNEPEVRKTVTEDDGTRIEELRVRGQLVKLTVFPKNAPAYEIVLGDASHDLSPGLGSTRGAIGKTVWRVLDF